MGKELNKTKKARQQDDPQTSVVQSPEAIPPLPTLFKTLSENLSVQQFNDLYHFNTEAMIINHFHAHKFITDELRERLNKDETVRIGKKVDYFSPSCGKSKYCRLNV